jgi:hypothetical protein
MKINDLGIMPIAPDEVDSQCLYWYDDAGRFHSTDGKPGLVDLESDIKEFYNHGKLLREEQLTNAERTFYRDVYKKHEWKNGFYS